MPRITPDLTSLAGAVRVRARATDTYEGLRGQAYLDARQMTRHVTRLDANCPDRLQAVINIIQARSQA